MDFDEDDLINDYVDEYEEPPMDEYDEAMIEAMMGGAVPNNHQKNNSNNDDDTRMSNKENSERGVLATTPALSPDAEDGRQANNDGSTKRLFATQDDDDDEAMEEPSAEVQNYIDSRSPQNSLYQFDRYVSIRNSVCWGLNLLFRFGIHHR